MLTTIKTMSGPITADSGELDGIGAVKRFLDESTAGELTLSGPSGGGVAIDGTVRAALRRVVEILARDRMLIIDAMTKELTVDQAAWVLNVPNRGVFESVEAGELAASEVRGRQRPQFDEVMRYKERRDAGRQEHLEHRSSNSAGYRILARRTRS